MSVQLTQEIGEFVAGLDARPIPQAAIATARTAFLDCAGVMIAGRVEDAPKILRETLAPGPGEASLWFTRSRVAAPEAAWLNATAAHVLDFDDTGLRGHPSTILVPAILAEAEELDATGADMLAAYIAGYEVWGELALRERGSLHLKGWHPTGIWGSVAAAAACASLRGLSAAQASAAVAIGASQSAGLVANFGTMTKPFHAGRSAHAGLLAARLAGAGFTGARDAIEHRQGLLCAVSQAGDTDLNRPSQFGRSWRILEHGLNIKKYPACYCAHRSIDGMLELLARTGFRADDVEEIGVFISERFGMVLRHHRPQSGLEAKFSMEFAMASAIIAGRVGLSELTDGFVRSPPVQSLMGRVSIELGNEYDDSHPNAAPYDRVRVRLKSGEELEGLPVRRARGHAEDPLTENELYEKFRVCLEAGGMGDDAPVLFDRLNALPGVSARDLTSPR